MMDTIEQAKAFTASGQVKTGITHVYGVQLKGVASPHIVKLYDGTDNTGTLKFEFQPVSSAAHCAPKMFPRPMRFKVGCYLEIAGGTNAPNPTIFLS